MNNPLYYTDPSGHIACEVLGTEDCDESGGYTNVDVSGPTASVESFLWSMVEKIHEKLAKIDDVEAIAQIADLATTFYDDLGQVLTFLSEVFVGIPADNPLILLEAALNRDINPGNSGLEFGDTGFHPDFRDGGNQVFHVWPYVVQGSWGIVGGLVGNFGNRFHERWQPFARGGKSEKDYALAQSGLLLGTLVYFDHIPLNQFGNAIRYLFGETGPGANIP